MKQKNLAVVEETCDYFAPYFSSPPRMSLDELEKEGFFQAMLAAFLMAVPDVKLRAN